MREDLGDLQDPHEALTEPHDGSEQDPHEALIELHHEDERGGRDTVLLVDDDEFDRFFLANAIARQLGRFQLLEAEDAGQALAYLRGDLAKKIVLIFTDGTMPGLHGVDFARTVRGEEVYGNSLPRHRVQALRRVPIKLVTGDATRHGYQDHVDSGLLQQVIQKPLNVENLGANIRQAVLRMGKRGYGDG